MVAKRKGNAASHAEEAKEALRSAGARVTQPRIAVLAALLGSDQFLAHHEIVERVGAVSVDRVTVYRVLEWLIEQEMAHRVAGEDRIWRFAATPGQPAHGGARGQRDHAHAHFQCTACHQTFCLDQLPAKVPVRLPKGYRMKRMELNIEGLCRRCS